MPKIPTFTPEKSITSEPSSVVSNIKLSPTSTVASALIPAAKQVQTYAIKKRDNEEKLEAKKTLLELKAESDKIIELQKDNPNEAESISVWKNSFEQLSNNKLANIKNPRIKKLVQDSIELENLESIYHLKTNSFKAYEKQSVQVYNDKINIDVAKYKSTDNAILKAKYRQEIYRDAEDFNKEHQLGSADLKKRLQTIDASLLFTDADYTIGLGFDNTAEQIAKIDSDINGDSFISNDLFSDNIFNSYNQKINELTIKGDPNADYDEAIRLLSQLENFERYNGSKVISEKKEIEFADLKQKVLVEQIQHENLLNKQGDNKAFLDFATDSKTSLLKSITDNRSGIPPTLEDRLIANEIEDEYEQMLRDYLDADPEASLINKKSFVRNLTFSLQNIYQDRKISKIRSRSFTEDTFDIVAEKNRVMEDVKLLALDELDITTRTRYEKIAKANGFITTVTIDGKQQKIGDIGAFLNVYLPVLQRQVKAVEIAE
ncbi:hypothetical protein [uncultured Mediterranean phage uvMED]|nr:hypothetical protein [uncultured Mediterranean phage uvMED]